MTSEFFEIFLTEDGAAIHRSELPACHTSSQGFACRVPVWSEFYSGKQMASEFFEIFLTEDGGAIHRSELSACHTSSQGFACRVPV